MSFHLVVSDRAQHTIKKAADWFFEQNPGLEIKFLKELISAMDYIQKNPKKCQLRYRNVRIKYLKKFDFGIHYIIDSNVVFVLAVFHTSQNADDWFQV